MLSHTIFFSCRYHGESLRCRHGYASERWFRAMVRVIVVIRCRQRLLAPGLMLFYAYAVAMRMIPFCCFDMLLPRLMMLFFFRHSVVAMLMMARKEQREQQRAFYGARAC